MATKANDAQAREEAPARENIAQIQEGEVDAGKEAVLAAYHSLLEASEHFKHAARAAGLDLKVEASEKLQVGREKAVSLGQQANEYAQERPLSALSIAFAAGFVVAQLLGRK